MPHPEESILSRKNKQEDSCRQAEENYIKSGFGTRASCLGVYMMNEI